MSLESYSSGSSLPERVIKTAAKDVWQSTKNIGNAAKDGFKNAKDPIGGTMDAMTNGSLQVLEEGAKRAAETVFKITGYFGRKLLNAAGETVKTAGTVAASVIKIPL